MLEIYGIITFDDVHEAMKSQKLDIPARTIPTPATIDSKCGISLRYAIDDKQMIIDNLNKNNVKYAKVFKVKKDGFNYEYSPE